MGWWGVGTQRRRWLWRIRFREFVGAECNVKDRTLLGGWALKPDGAAGALRLFV
jgi:hypothetical protein